MPRPIPPSEHVEFSESLAGSSDNLAATVPAAVEHTVAADGAGGGGIRGLCNVDVFKPIFSPRVDNDYLSDLFNINIKISNTHNAIFVNYYHNFQIAELWHACYSFVD